MNAGIVGAEGAKFTAYGERMARQIIREILAPADVVLVSGGCHLGGIDIWAEEEYAAIRATQVRPDPIIHLPAVLEWAKGFEPRNRLIVRDSAIVHNITVQQYHAGFKGPRFNVCYHCSRRFRATGRVNAPHVKSGGCWTAYEAEKAGKRAIWYIVREGP